jgi:3-deoxy-D-manno-octulosonic-acid transferase
MRLTSWFWNSCYLTLLAIFSPWIIWSAIRHGKYREGFGQRLLGRVPRTDPLRPCVWLHAVSVGEVNLLESIIAKLDDRHPRWQLVLSTTTKAGYDLARRKYSDRTVFYCPLDFSWAVRAAISRIQPDLLLLAELELWPNLINVAKQSGTRVAIVNGRLGDRSFRGYLRIRPIVAKLLRQIDLVAAQNEETAKRFLRLGANQSAVHATGSLKFDGARTERDHPRARQLRALAGFDQQQIILLGGSTQQPEEAYLVEIFRTLAGARPDLRLVLVPRHPQRFDEVARLLDASGLAWQRRSELGDCEAESSADTAAASAPLAPRPAILLVDTIGELSSWWASATIGFVGGTFGSRGGQNMIEPAAYGVATSFGPNTWNFRDIVSGLRASRAAVVVRDQSELLAFAQRALADVPWREELGSRARHFVLSQQGATDRTIELIEGLLPSDGESSRSSAA